MESAFGVEHGEVSKGIPKGIFAAAKGKPGAGTFSAKARILAHQEGQAAGKAGSMKPFHIAEGKRARVRSRPIGKALKLPGARS